MVIPTAIVNGEPLEVFEWEVRIPAMQNSFYVAMCNRVGLEGEMDFWGGSILAGPNGGLVAKADHSEQILYADYDLELQAKAAAERPYIPLMRSALFPAHGEPVEPRHESSQVDRARH